MALDVALPVSGLDPASPEDPAPQVAGPTHKHGPARLQPTAEILDHLPSHAWRVLHDVCWPGREGQLVDHVVIGPGGIFVIDVRHWEGPVVLEEGILRVEDRPREREVAESADAALAVAAVLERIEPRWVFPVLCLVREEPVAGMTRGVLYSSIDLLEQLITSRREVISVDRARFIAQLLEIKLVGDQRSAPEDPPPKGRAAARAAGRAAERTAERAATPPRPRRRRLRLAPGLGRILMRSTAVGLVIAVLVGDPDLLDRGASFLSSLLRVT